MDDAVQVDADDPFPHAHRSCPRIAGADHAGVVAQDVSRAEVFERPLGERLDRLLERRVAHHGQDFATRLGQLRLDRAEPHFIELGEHDLHALRDETFGERLADSAAGTRDDCDLARQVLHVRHPRHRCRTVRHMDPLNARKTWRSMEAVHGMIYFTADAREEYAVAGLTKPRAQYFASRAAAMGAVDAEVVIATFYNFHPGLVRHSMQNVWGLTTPHSLIAARQAAADTTLRRVLGEELLASAELAAAAAALRECALVACEHPEGRPLFAGHSSLTWPGDDQPHLVLWHAQTLLREFRGDGHVAALTLEGLSGLEALISHGASGDVPGAVLQASRSWSDDEWRAGIERMASKGLVDTDGSFTEAGRGQRDRIEDATGRAAFVAFAGLGDDTAAELRETGNKLTKLLVDAGVIFR